MFVAFRLFFPIYVFQRRGLFDKVDEREGQDDAWRVKLRKKTTPCYFSGCVHISAGRKVMKSFPMPSGIGFCKINLCPSTNLQTGCQWKSRRFLQQTTEFLWLPTATNCIANGCWDGYISNDPVWMKSTAKVMNLYNATQEGRALCWHDHDYNLRWWDVIWRIRKFWEV